MVTQVKPKLTKVEKIKPLWYYWDKKLNKYYGSFTSTLKAKLNGISIKVKESK